jgi:hypothetical protein
MSNTDADWAVIRLQPPKLHELACTVLFTDQSLLFAVVGGAA